MWPFRSRPITFRLDPEQEARITALERRVDEIDVEWSDWFGKFRRLYASMSKRAKAEESREAAPEEPQNGTKGIPPLNRPMNPLAAQLLRGMRPGD